MPRIAREKCESGIYHVMLRGINRNDIFHDDEDFLRFLETLKRTKICDSYKVYAYCLMNNHVHLLLHEQMDEISKTMKRIGVSYAWWYNWKYNRVGHLFQDRYRSESINDDGQILNILRYIHNNPVKAVLVNHAERYKWSSCKAYYDTKEYPAELTDRDFVLDLLSNNRTIAVSKLKEFTKQDNKDKFMENEVRLRKSDDEIQEAIKDILCGISVATLQTMEKKERDKSLNLIKEIEGITQRQIARITGICQSTISQAQSKEPSL